jgi:DNA polymerase V
MAKNDISLQFGKVLKEARLIAGLSQEELALESDLDRTYISMLERSIKIPTISTLVKLSGPLSKSPAQLLLRAQQLEHIDIVPKPKRSSNRLTLFGTSVSCGTPVGHDFVIEKELSLDELMVKKPSETFFIKASGDSMSPAIWDGDILVIHRDVKPKNGSIILAQIDEEFTVKRYFKTSKGIQLLPENPDFKEIWVTEEMKFIFCGAVIGTTRVF